MNLHHFGENSGAKYESDQINQPKSWGAFKVKTVSNHKLVFITKLLLQKKLGLEMKGKSKKFGFSNQLSAGSYIEKTLCKILY